MAETKPANIFTTLEAIGQREDLINEITNIDPTETQFLSICSKNKSTATARLHQWQTEKYADPVKNAVPEGADFLADAITPTVMLTNRCQISRKGIVVSRTVDKVKKAGRGAEYAHAIDKAATELKRDMEVVLSTPQTPQDETSISSVRQLRDLTGWYSTNVDKGAGGVNGTSTAARQDGTPRALTEAMFKTLVQGIFEAGGTADTVLCRPVQKVKMSAWVGNATRTIDATKQKVVSNIEIYVSDFGEHKIVATHFTRPKDVHVLDTRYWGIAYLDPMKMETVGKTGDNSKGYWITEYTLVSKNEAASGLITDLS